MGTCCSKTSSTAAVDVRSKQKLPTHAPSSSAPPTVPAPTTPAEDPSIKQEKDKKPSDNKDTIATPSRNDLLERVASDEITHTTSIGDLSDSSSGARVSRDAGDGDPLELGTFASPDSSAKKDNSAEQGREEVGQATTSRSPVEENEQGELHDVTVSDGDQKPQDEEEKRGDDCEQQVEPGSNAVADVGELVLTPTPGASPTIDEKTSAVYASPVAPVTEQHDLDIRQDAGFPNKEDNQTTSADDDTQLEAHVSERTTLEILSHATTTTGEKPIAPGVRAQLQTPVTEQTTLDSLSNAASPKTPTISGVDNVSADSTVTHHLETTEAKPTGKETKQSGDDKTRIDDAKDETKRSASPIGLLAMAAAARKAQSDSENSDSMAGTVDSPTSPKPRSPITAGGGLASMAAMAAARRGTASPSTPTATPEQAISSKRSSCSNSTASGGLAAMAAMAAARKKAESPTPSATTSKDAKSNSVEAGGGHATAEVAPTRKNIKELPTSSPTNKTSHEHRGGSSGEGATGGGGLAAMATIAAARRNAESPTTTTKPEKATTSSNGSSDMVAGGGGLAAMAAMAAARRNKDSHPPSTAPQNVNNSNDETKGIASGGGLAAIAAMAAAKRNKNSPSPPPTKPAAATGTVNSTFAHIASKELTSEVSTPSTPPPPAELADTATGVARKDKSSVDESSPTTVTSTPTPEKSGLALMAANAAASQQNQEVAASHTTATTASENHEESSTMSVNQKPDEMALTTRSQGVVEEAYESSVVSSTRGGFDRYEDDDIFDRHDDGDAFSLEQGDMMLEDQDFHDESTWMGLDPPPTDDPETLLMKMKFLRDDDDITMEDAEETLDELDPPDAMIEDSFGLEPDVSAYDVESEAGSFTEADERPEAMKAGVGDELDVLGGTTHTLELENSVHCNVGIRAADFYSTVELDPPEQAGGDDEDTLMDLLPEKYRYDLDTEVEDDESTNMSFVLAQLDDAETVDIVGSVATTSEVMYAPIPASEDEASKSKQASSSDELGHARADELEATSARESTLETDHQSGPDEVPRTKFARRCSEPWSLDVSSRSMLMESRNYEEDFAANKKGAMGGMKAEDGEAALDVVLGRRGRSTYYQPSLDDEILIRNIRSTYYQPSLDEVMTRIISRSTYKDPVGGLSHRSVEGRRALYIHFAGRSMASAAAMEDDELSDLE